MRPMPEAKLTTAASMIAAPTPPNSRGGDAGRRRSATMAVDQHQLLAQPPAQRRRDDRCRSSTQLSKLRSPHRSTRCCSGSPRSQNSSSKNRKPMTARIMLIAVAAERNDALRSSIRSAGCADGATAPFGNFDAAITASPNITMPNSSDSFGEIAANAACRCDGERADGTRDQAELRVGLDQFGLAVDHRRDQRRPRHPVGLLQDHHAERQREQQQIVEVEDHQQEQQRPADGGELDDQSPAARGCVDQWARSSGQRRRTVRS